MRKHSLKREIILMLAIKLSLLYVIWHLCFAHPLDEQHLSAAITSHIFNQQQETNS